MQEVFEKIIEKLEETKKLGTKHYEEGKYIYTSPDYDHETLKKAIEIVKQEAEKHEECYKDCGECESYNKERHHCPKFCKVITEAVKEIEENHSGWIPCSERLPKEHKLYDITFRNSAGIHSDSAIYNPYLKRWLWDADETELVENEVLAWAEKREPYQPSGDHKKKTNFDMCCESMEAMAQIIDIAKIGWTKEQIIEWLQKEECEVPE